MTGSKTSAAADAIRADSLRVWTEELGGVESVALLDFPSYANAGDSLIYAGERAYLKQLGVRVRYMCNTVHYDPEVLRARHPEGPLLIRGGGNLGDRWAAPQALRERIIQDFPGRRIIQLPQSVDFSGEAGTIQCQRVFGAHRDLTVMVRETPSFEKATKLFPDNKVVYCPDSAFGADLSEHRRPAPKHDVVKLLRQDNEKVERAISIEGPTFDWGFFGLEAYKWSAIRYPQTITERFRPPVVPCIRRSSQVTKLRRE